MLQWLLINFIACGLVQKVLIFPSSPLRFGIFLKQKPSDLLHLLNLPNLGTSCQTDSGCSARYTLLLSSLTKQMNLTASLRLQLLLILFLISTQNSLWKNIKVLSKENLRDRHMLLEYIICNKLLHQTGPMPSHGLPHRYSIPVYDHLIQRSAKSVRTCERPEYRGTTKKHIKVQISTTSRLSLLGSARQTTRYGGAGHFVERG